MSNENMWLEHIYVDGLHGELTIDARFNSGINVIYGDNGVGKTTLLHIISNIANCDFNRFKFLSFRKIVITMSDGTEIEVIKNSKDGVPNVSIDNKSLSVSDKRPNGSEAERELFHKYFGKRPAYVPAFRSVLQKIENRPGSHWDQAVIGRGILGSFGRTGSVLEDENSSVQGKTEQCRSWFGDFVPIIRYPSVEEAETELESYWVRADNAARREKANVISEATNYILADLLGQSPKALRELIDGILDDIPETGSEVRKLRKALPKAVVSAARTGRKDSDPTELTVHYIGALIDAQVKGKKIFKKVNRFVHSMNKFLGPDREFVLGGEYSNKPKPKISFKNSSQRDYNISGLSSGERQLLTLLFAAWQDPNDSKLMLVDEPEISLHIDWQRRILKEMYRQSEQQIIACTHAPEVAADLTEGYQVFDRFSFSNDDRG